MMRHAKHLLVMLRTLNPWKWVSALLCGLVIWMMVFGDMGIRDYYTLLQTRDSFQQKIAEANQRIDDLHAEKKNLQDPHYLESVIRSELGYLRSDEIIFKLQPSTTTDTPSEE